MEFVITAFWILCELTNYSILSDAFLKKRGRSKYFIVCFTVAWLILFVASRLLKGGVIKFLVTIAISIVLTAYIYKGRWYQYILCALLSYGFGAVVDTFIAYGCSVVLRISYSEIMWKKFLYTIIGTISKLLHLLIMYVIHRYRKHRDIKGIDAKWIVMMLLFPVTSIIMIIAIFDSYREKQDLSMGAFSYSCILMIANVAIVYLISLMEKSVQKENDMSLLNQQMEIQTKHIIEIDKRFQEQRKLTHDFKQHIQTVNYLLLHNQHDQARAYMHKLQGIAPVHSFALESNHAIVDAVINKKYQDAREQNIEVQLHVNDLKGLCLDDSMIVVLLSNLFDNAIEACARVKGRREIYCSILFSDAGLFISIQNTSLPIVINNGYIQTTKENPEEHGYGLKNVYYILERLAAEYSITYEEPWVRFVAEISHLQ